MYVSMYSAISLKIIMKRSIGCLSQTHKSLDPRHSIHSPLSLSPPSMLSVFYVWLCWYHPKQSKCHTPLMCVAVIGVWMFLHLFIQPPCDLSHNSYLFAIYTFLFVDSLHLFMQLEKVLFYPQRVDENSLCSLSYFKTATFLRYQ